MMRLKLVALLFLISCSAFAQKLWVYSITGSAEKKEGSSWISLQHSDILSGNDSIRTGKTSSMTILDRSNNKLYSFQGETPISVKDVISSQQKNPSLAKEFISYLWKSANGKLPKEAKSAGVVYRDGGNANLIANSLTKYKVDIELLDVESGKEVGDVVKIGQRALFKVRNHADIPLFVNVIDVDAAGNMAECIPVPDQSYMPLLMVPANSEVVLIDFPVEFSHPAGVDTLIPLAWHEPYDVKVVIENIKTISGNENIKTISGNQIMIVE